MYKPNQSDPSQQPEWRLPLRSPVTPMSALPPQPPRPPTAGYDPATYGQSSNPQSRHTVSPSPVSPVSMLSTDTRTWGVQYNKHQIYAPPPLPPRPPSVHEQQQQQHQQHQQQPQPQPQQPYTYVQAHPEPHLPAALTNIPPPSSIRVDDGEAFADARPPSVSSIPPPYNFPPRQNESQTQPYHAPSVPALPPKIPPNHNAPVQQNFEQAQPSLPAQQAQFGPVTTQGSYGFPQNPPLGPSPGPTSSSALGYGTPSDWEHLGPTEGDFDDAPWFPPRDHAPPPPGGHIPPGFPPDPIPGLNPSTSPSPAPAVAPAPLQPQSRASSHQETPLNMYQSSHPQRADSFSPVSPSTMTRFDSQGPLPPVRVETTSTNDSWSPRAESIDNVIDAWVKPLQPSPNPAQPIPEEMTSRAEVSSPRTPMEGQKPIQSPFQSPPLDIGVTPSTVASMEPQESITPSQTVLQAVDPYEDLDPWSKSSLTRYVAMLRKEAVADSDEERYKIFTAFTAKETKLREILYNIEAEHPVVHEKPHASSRNIDPSPPHTEEPRVPIESGLIPVETEEPDESNENLTSSPEEIDVDDQGSEYSAGGRPVLRKQTRRESSQWQPNLSLLSSSKELPPKSSSQVSSVPISEEKQVLEPLATEPPRPIYTPFQYTEGPQRGSDNLKFDRPAYQAYSDLRQASAISGRVGSSKSTNPASSFTSQTEHDETFVGLIRHKSNSYQVSGRGAVSTLPSLSESLRRGSQDGLVEELRAIVWAPLNKQSESSWHITTREELEKLSEDLSYVQNTIDKWEHDTSVRRQRLDQDRAARQEDSEAQIDALFDGKEIGYADINTLEEDFRQTEARTQLDEERQEVEKFMSEVFNPLDERLKNEISALRKSYDSALNQLDREQKGKNNASDRRSPSITMKLVNEIHNSLEIRFQKRLELALDCERRRKRAERRPLVFMGDMATLRKLDGDFDRMERRNILEAAKDRDERANRLMDSFDDAILHGLGMNQSLLDELVSKAARLDPTTLRSSGLPDSEIEQILKSTATFAASLRSDSEAILRCSGLADMALNDADYAVSVAEAQYANSEPDIFERLEAEKKKEDSLLQGDLDSKLQSIQKGPRDLENTINRLISDLAKFPRFTTVSSIAEEDPIAQPADMQSLQPLPLGLRPATVAPSPSPSPPAQVSDPETEHQERLRRALNDAKRRNAARTNQ